MTITEILSALERYTGRFPYPAMQAAVEQREAITPELLRILQAVADDAPSFARNNDYMLHMFAVYLLAQFRETRAFPILIKLISWPGKTTDDLLGDTITEGLPGLLASVFDDDLDLLTQVALNDQAEPFARSSVMDAMALLYLENRITREQILSVFRRLYGELNQECNVQAWNGLTDATADAGLSELLPEIREAFGKGLADGFFADLKSLEFKLSGPREKVIANFKYHRHLIDDAIDEMCWWAAFKKDDEAAKKTKRKPRPYFDLSLPQPPRPAEAAVPSNAEPRVYQ